MPTPQINPSVSWGYSRNSNLRQYAYNKLHLLRKSTPCYFYILHNCYTPFHLHLAISLKRFKSSIICLINLTVYRYILLHTANESIYCHAERSCNSQILIETLSKSKILFLYSYWIRIVLKHNVQTIYTALLFYSAQYYVFILGSET